MVKNIFRRLFSMLERRIIIEGVTLLVAERPWCKFGQVYLDLSGSLGQGLSKKKAHLGGASLESILPIREGHVDMFPFLALSKIGANHVKIGPKQGWARIFEYSNILGLQWICVFVFMTKYTFEYIRIFAQCFEYILK